MLGLLNFQVFPIFLFFVVPGVVATKVYTYFIPAERRQLADYLVELVAFSMFYLALFFWLIALVLSPNVQANGLLCIPLVFLSIFIVPALLGWLASNLLQAPWLRKWVRSPVHPIPMSWDYFFSRGKPCWIIFHLKTGERIGGYFGAQSFASSYPDPQEVYIEEIWSLDEQGKFVARVERTSGGYVKMEECKLIEFLS